MGSMLIIAPHQDDESLGCGGTIALATNAGIDVHVIFVTDGSLSHPSSNRYPRVKLVRLREKEAIKALLILGVKATNIHFMKLPDGNLPTSSNSEFGQYAESMSDLLKVISPCLVFMPWRRDPHSDHRATWQITMKALKSADLNPDIFEYFIWLFERATAQDQPFEHEGQLYYVDISTTAKTKKSAILAHVSQTTDLINDDQNGFKLSADMLAHFDYPKEYFIQNHFKNMTLNNPQSLSENYFDEVYRQKDDPWDLATSRYERDKYRNTIAALPRAVYNSALEIGCSIGVLTEALVPKCARILAIDVADAPILQARERLAKYPKVELMKMTVPAAYPNENFDLVVMSEVGYFFSIPDLSDLFNKIYNHLNYKGQLLLVHWTHFVPDFPLTGDQVHQFFMEPSGSEKRLEHLLHQRTDDYRLDLFEKK
jgi:LmbE family N-acetylglucosaminyl deacetylase/ubiquinone/menaquinone biosynthesis C-methylase UbiE